MESVKSEVKICNGQRYKVNFIEELNCFNLWFLADIDEQEEWFLMGRFENEYEVGKYVIFETQLLCA